MIPGLRPPFASVDPFSPQSLQGDSTVVGTSKLRNLYERFEEELGRRQARAKAARPKWEPPKTKLDEDPGERSSRACWPPDWEVWAARNWSAITWCHREGQEVEPQWSRDRAGWLSSPPALPGEGSKRDKSGQRGSRLQPELHFCVSDDSSSESECESDADGSTCSSSSDSDVFDVIAEIKRKKAHPDRLHEELWYNDPGQVSRL